MNPWYSKKDTLSRTTPLVEQHHTLSPTVQKSSGISTRQLGLVQNRAKNQRGTQERKTKRLDINKSANVKYVIQRSCRQN